MTVIVTPKAAPAKAVAKDDSMLKQKEMMAAHYDRLTQCAGDRRQGRLDLRARQPQRTASCASTS